MPRDKHLARKPAEGASSRGSRRDDSEDSQERARPHKRVARRPVRCIETSSKGSDFEDELAHEEEEDFVRRPSHVPPRPPPSPQPQGEPCRISFEPPHPVGREVKDFT